MIYWNNVRWCNKWLTGPNKNYNYADWSLIYDTSVIGPLHLLNWMHSAIFRIAARLTKKWDYVNWSMFGTFHPLIELSNIEWLPVFMQWFSHGSFNYHVGLLSVFSVLRGMLRPLYLLWGKYDRWYPHVLQKYMLQFITGWNIYFCEEIRKMTPILLLILITRYVRFVRRVNLVHAGQSVWFPFNTHCNKWCIPPGFLIYVAMTEENGIMGYATSITPDQPAHPRSLIRGYTGRNIVSNTCIKLKWI